MALLGLQCQVSKVVASPQTDVPPQIQEIVQSLARNPRQSSLWKRLGKLQLDAGEFAEARRVFCHGWTQCPDDDSLKHHERVFQTFHRDNEELSNVKIDNNNDDDDNGSNDDHELPPLVIPQHLQFFSFDVPDHAIPDFVRNYPFGTSLQPRTRIIHASENPIIPAHICHHLIKSAIRTTDRIGWTKDRHLQAPTCDVPVFDLDAETCRWVRNALHLVLFPLLSQLIAPELEISPDEWRVQDCFIVRYDAPPSDQEGLTNPGFPSLRPHEDESLLSLTIALNDFGVDYEDGGLYIACIQEVLNGPAGTVLCFAGGLTHGGYPIKRGTRWILTVFLYVDRNLSGKKPGYTLDAIQSVAH